MDNIDATEKNLTSKEVSVRLKVSEKTLSAWRASGKGPRFFYANPKDKTSPRYPESEIIAIEQNLRNHM